MSIGRARRRDVRLLPVAAFTWLCAGLAVQFAGGAGSISAVAALASVACLVVSLWRRSGVAAIVAVGLAFGAAASAHIALQLPERETVANLSLGGGRSLTVDAVVVGKVEPSTRGWRFDAVVEEIMIGGDRTRASVPIAVRTAVSPAGLDLGASISVTGTARPADDGRRPVLIIEAAVPPLIRSPAQGVLGAAADLRQGLQRSVSGLPQPAAGLIAGLSVGDTSGVSVELDAVMKSSSLSHLTAVSGANCALVVGIAFGAAALLGLRRGVRIAAGLAALIGFVVLVSPEPSVVRAATMAAIAMIALLLGRVGAGVAVLSAAVVLILVVDPWLALSLGFALSAAATASLLLVAGPLADGLATWMPSPLALALSVPIAAQLACGPLLVLIEPTVPLYGVLANAVAGPAAPVGTILGLLACLSVALPWVAMGLAGLAWLPAAWVAGTAETAAGLPGHSVPWLGGVPGLVTLAVVGAAVFVAATPRGPVHRWRVAAIVVLAATTGAVVAVGPLTDAWERARIPRRWSIVACDVGQGDALLVRSAGRVALIDTGPEPALLAHCLSQFGVERVDLLVITHFDLDHFGGIDAVQGNVDLVLHGPVPNTEVSSRLRVLAAGGARPMSAAAGTSGALGDAQWRTMWPRSAAHEGNDASVVIEFTGGGVPSILLLGDLSASPQTSLLGSLDRTYDVVKVAHHGSADQHPPLYDRIAPRIALVTVGDNSFGHPRHEILDYLEHAGARIARTDRSGAIALWLESGGLTIWRERGVGAPE